MRASSLVLAALAATACRTANEYYQPTEIVGGPGTIIRAEARTANADSLIADLSAHRTGTLTVGSDLIVSGVVTVNDTVHGVTGKVLTEGTGLVFEVSGLFPDRFTVVVDNGDLYHYQLVAQYEEVGDVTGDGIAETYRIVYEVEK